MTQRQIGSESRQVKRQRERRESAQNHSLSGLMRDDKPKTYIVRINNEEWVFSYHDVPWGSYLKHVANNWSGEEFNVVGYYEDMLLDSITSFPDGSKPTRSILQMFTPDVFFQLSNIVPKPSFGGAVEDGKKDSPLLEVDEEEIEMEVDSPE